MVTARATPNIALIKYWGNRDDALRLPAADSLSMTLDHPSVTISVEPSDTLNIRSVHPDGTERNLKEKDLERFARHLHLTKEYLKAIDAPVTFPESVSLHITSDIPPSIGLASSSAIFSCLAKAYAELIRDQFSLHDEQISVLARLGSGSAARGIFGGFSAIAVHGDGIDGAHAMQIANEDHWRLYDIIIAPSMEEKAHGSTEGHALAPTSPYFAHRLKELPRRQRESIDAIHKKDFEKLQSMTEEDCMDMHHVMRTSTPPLHYLSPETYLIVDDIITLRKQKNVPVLFTMDAGPTVHLLCLEEALPEVRAYAKEQEKLGRTVFEAKVGKGAHVV